MRRQRRHVEHRRRRHDDARGAAQRQVEQRLVEQPVLPARADHLAVEPDHQRRVRAAPARRPAAPSGWARAGRSRRRPRATATAAASASATPRRRRPKLRHARHGHPVHDLVHGARPTCCSTSARGLERAVVAAAQRLEHGLDAAAVGRVVLAEVQDLRSGSSPRPPAGSSGSSRTPPAARRDRPRQDAARVRAPSVNAAVRQGVEAARGSARGPISATPSARQQAARPRPPTRRGRPRGSRWRRCRRPRAARACRWPRPACRTPSPRRRAGRSPSRSDGCSTSAARR